MPPRQAAADGNEGQVAKLAEEGDGHGCGAAAARESATGGVTVGHALSPLPEHTVAPVPATCTDSMLTAERVRFAFAVPVRACGAAAGAPRQLHQPLAQLLRSGRGRDGSRGAPAEPQLEGAARGVAEQLLLLVHLPLRVGVVPGGARVCPCVKTRGRTRR